MHRNTALGIVRKHACVAVLLLNVLISVSCSRSMMEEEGSLGSSPLSAIYSDPAFPVSTLAGGRDGRIYLGSSSDPSRLSELSGDEIVPAFGKASFGNKEQWGIIRKAVVTGPWLWLLSERKDSLTLGMDNRLLRLNAITGETERSYPVNAQLGDKLILTDMAIDTGHSAAFITDAGLGAIVVVDLETGVSRQVLRGSRFMSANPGKEITIGGRVMSPAEAPLLFHIGVICTAPSSDEVFFKCPGDDQLFKISSAALSNPGIESDTLVTLVRDAGRILPTASLVCDAKGSLYFGDLLETRLMKRYADGALRQMTSDPRLVAVRHLQIVADNDLYFIAGGRLDTGIWPLFAELEPPASGAVMKVDL